MAVGLLALAITTAQPSGAGEGGAHEAVRFKLTDGSAELSYADGSCARGLGDAGIDPVISPDGRYGATYMANGDDTADIILYDFAQGSHVVARPAEGIESRFMDLGGFNIENTLVFAAPTEGEYGASLYTVNADGSAFRRHDVQVTHFVEAPAWIDSSTVIFSSNRSLDGLPPEIYAYDVGTGNARLLYEGVGMTRTPGVASDGQHFAFHHETWNDSKIYLGDAQGSPLITLASGDSYAPPVLSPDATQAAYTELSTNETRVVDVATQHERVVYTGTGQIPPAARQWTFDDHLVLDTSYGYLPS